MRIERTKPTPEELRDVAGTCTCFALRKAARAVTQIYDDALRPSGLGAPQFNLLVAVALMDQPTVGRLARNLAMDPTTLLRNLAPLRRENLIVVRIGGDRRTRVVALSERGWAALARALPLWRQAQARLAHRLDGNQLSGLGERLDAIARLAQDG